MRMAGSPGGQRTNREEDSVVLFELPSFVFGVAGADALAVSVVIVVQFAPWLSAAFAFWQIGGEDNSDSFDGVFMICVHLGACLGFAMRVQPLPEPAHFQRL